MPIEPAILHSNVLTDPNYSFVPYQITNKIEIFNWITNMNNKVLRLNTINHMCNNLF